MNNRDYKKFTSGTISHIYNRGNNKEIVFRDNDDYRAFLYRLALALGFETKDLSENPMFKFPYSRIRITPEKRDMFKLHSFCLMPNHFHLLIEQQGKTPISKIISRTCTSFSKYINKKYNRVGHLFQDQFKSVLIETNPQFMWTSAYIHMNPVKSKMVNNPNEYNWSSYKDIVGKRDLPIVHRDLLIEIFGNTEKLEKETLIYDLSNVVKGHL